MPRPPRLFDLSELGEANDNPFHPVVLRRDVDEALTHVRRMEKLFWKVVVPLFVTAVGGICVALFSRWYSRTPDAPAVVNPAEVMGADRKRPPKPLAPPDAAAPDGSL